MLFPLFNTFFSIVGDAILVVTGRSVVLYDTDGKEIGKANGYKIQELDQLKEGETLPVGTREIEVSISVYCLS